MKEYTKFLKERSMRDIHRVFADNNSKKSCMDEVDYIKAKIQSVEAIRDNWISFYSAATTPRQSEYCNKVLDVCEHKLRVLRDLLIMINNS